MADSEDAKAPKGLAGPDAVLVKTRSLPGPCASNRLIRLASVRVPIVNTGTKDLSLTGISVDPLHVAERGVGTGGSFQVQSTKDTLVLAPGAGAEVVLAGRVPARPGSYASTLRLRADTGEMLNIPVSIAVGASPLWGIACMLLGLSLLGVMNVLSGESEVQSALRNAIRFRQQAHEWIELTPPPESRAADVLAMDREIAAAIGALNRPRGWSFVDHRVADANERLQSARNIEDELHKSVAGQPAGAGELRDLERDWNALQGHMADIRSRLAAAAGGTASQSFAGSVNNFLFGFAQAFLAVPMKVFEDQIAPELARVRLTADAGRNAEAAASAITVRRWLQRIAVTLDQRLTLVLGIYADGLDMIDDDVRIQHRIEADGITGADRHAVLDPLDQAAAALRDNASLDGFAAAHRLVLDAGTALLRVERTLMINRVNQALAAAYAETGLDDITQAGGEMPAKPDEAMRRAYLLRIVSGWRAHLRLVPDPKERQALGVRVDALEKALHGPDLKSAAAPMKALETAWSDYVPRRIAQVSSLAAAPICEAWRADLRRHLDGIEQGMRLVGSSALSEWDSRLGQLRLAQLGIRQGDCNAVIALGRQALALDNDVFTASLADAPIPPDAKLGAAETSSVAAAIALARKLLTEPRPLTITVVTPEEERYAGRQIMLRIGKLDPVWQAGVSVGIDFADGSPPLVLNVEALRRQGEITHVFPAKLTGTMQVAVATGFRPGTLIPLDAALGTGTAPLFVLPSPVSAARQLADFFFNSRFILALAIAGIVYYWRFESRDRVFGARGFDYVEAFALGFAVDAAVSDLPGAIVKLVG
jgi:hypothetical protein